MFLYACSSRVRRRLSRLLVALVLAVVSGAVSGQEPPATQPTTQPTTQPYDPLERVRGRRVQAAVFENGRAIAFGVVVVAGDGTVSGGAGEETVIGEVFDNGDGSAVWSLSCGAGVLEGPWDGRGYFGRMGERQHEVIISEFGIGWPGSDEAHWSRLQVAACLLVGLQLWGVWIRGYRRSSENM